MKYQPLLLFLVLFAFTNTNLQAQKNVAISDDPAHTAAKSAILDVQAMNGDKGVLIPRVTSAQRTGIATPANGLLVYDLGTASFWYYKMNAWEELLGGNTRELADNDNDTKVQVEKNTDDDNVRFDVGGNERLNLSKAGNFARLSFPNNNGNVLIGQGISGGITAPGNNNIILGNNAATKHTLGESNVFLGNFAAHENTTGGFNVFIGENSGYTNIDGNNNTYLGRSAGFSNLTGDGNVAIGHNAGYNNIGNKSVFIGENAGYSEANSDRLYIDNSNTTTPLIYGEFDNNLVRINNNLDFTGTFTQKGNEYLPVGSVVMYAGSAASIPAGWLKCDGATFSATTYPILNTRLGANRTPNFNGRFPIGVGNNGTLGSVQHNLRTTGGTEKHELSISEMPQHRHGISYREGEEQGSGLDYSDLGGTGVNDNTEYEGGSQPHTNMPPFYTVYFIIKAE